LDGFIERFLFKCIQIYFHNGFLISPIKIWNMCDKDFLKVEMDF